MRAPVHGKVHELRTKTCLLTTDGRMKITAQYLVHFDALFLHFNGISTLEMSAGCCYWFHIKGRISQFFRSESLELGTPW